MPYPVGWPPRPVVGIGRSLRFYVADTATANFSDRAYLFYDDVGANTNVPTPLFAPGVPVTTIQSPHGAGQEPTDSDPRTGRVQAKPYVWARRIRIFHDTVGGNDLQITFTDSDVVQGVLKAPPVGSPAGSFTVWECADRFESGIAVRGNGVAFRIEAW